MTRLEAGTPTLLCIGGLSRKNSRSMSRCQVAVAWRPDQECRGPPRCPGSPVAGSLGHPKSGHSICRDYRRHNRTTRRR
eukprot:6925932-Pyramimonas_sp.AAC.1